ncbi:MAG TPA: CAP domain-containing protein [Candidatus Limnocylindrales bacterium]|nr:CAP domain-containing protein [Candidatus Limnocylindrales bacterium]
MRRRRLCAGIIAGLLLAACAPGPAASSSPGTVALNLMFQNQYSAASARLVDQLRAHPTDAQSHAAYALLLNYESKQKPALQEAETALKLAPADGYVLTVLTRVQDWNNNVSQAISRGAQAVKASPSSALAHAFYGEALADGGQYATAQAELRKAATLAGQSRVAYERAEAERDWANYYQDRKDYPQALAHFKLAATDQPQWVERVLELARFSINRQDLPGATAYLQRAVQISPDDAGLREQLGTVALFAQDYGVAKSAYQAALRLQPRNALDLMMLGDIAVALDRSPSTGADDERAAVSAEPTNAEAGAYLVAILRYLQGNESAAVAAAQHSVAPPTASGTAVAYLDLDQEALNRQAVALSAVNRYRQIAGLAPVPASAIIHQSALAHAFYTFFNGADPQLLNLGIHNEVKGDLGYTGDNQLARAEHFGYAPHSMGEVITHRDDPQAAVSDWIDSVYHRLPLLRADVLELGYGDAYLDSMKIQVMDLSFRERSTGRIIVYPAADQQDVPVAFNGNEIPDPAPSATYPIGYPVTATFDRLANVVIGTYHLRDPSGADLPGYVLRPKDPDMENSFAFMALTPLKANTTYSMELSGTQNGIAFHKLWSFHTAAAGTGVTAQATANAALSR